MTEIPSRMRSARLHLWISGVITLAGLLVTLISYSSAGAGGRYILAWGAIVFGGLYFAVSAWEYRSGKKKAEEDSSSTGPDDPR